MRARVLELTGPDPGPDETELFGQILRSFADSSQGSLEELVAAVALGDAGKAEQLAHSLRGSATNLGGDVLAGLLESVEAGCRAGRLPPAEDLSALEEELAPLRAALRVVAGELEAGAAAGS